MYQQQPDESTQPMPAVPADAKSRRDFLKAAVIGSAAVATVGGAAAAGYALTSRKPSSVRFIGNVASGQCLSLKQGGKFGPSNPNNFLQLDISYLGDIGTESGTKDGNGNFPIDFTHCGTSDFIYFSLTDKNHSNFVIFGKLVETGGLDGNYSYVNGSNGDIYLAFTDLSGSQASLNDEYPEGSCLVLSCTSLAPA
jgi:hypothetical protein